MGALSPYYRWLCRMLSERFGVQVDAPRLFADMVGRTGGRPEQYTCGDLHQLICTLRRQQNADGAIKYRPVRPVYRRLRDAIGRAWGVPRRDVRPSTNLGPLMRRRGGSRAWKLLERELGASLPPMQGPGGLLAITTAVEALAFFATLGAFALGAEVLDRLMPETMRGGPIKGWAVLPLLPIALAPIFLAMGLSGWAGRGLKRLPAYARRNVDQRTVRKLVRELAMHPEQAKEIDLPWAPESAWYVLRHVLAEEVLWTTPQAVRRDRPLFRDGSFKCDACGYPLRCVHDRCPECGAPVEDGTESGPADTGVEAPDAAAGVPAASK